MLASLLLASDGEICSAGDPCTVIRRLRAQICTADLCAVDSTALRRRRHQRRHQRRRFRSARDEHRFPGVASNSVEPGRAPLRYEIKVREQQESLRNQRKLQVDRAEKIRTYNYKDNRVTDHWLKMNFELTSFLLGDIETAVQSCISMEQKELMEELAESVTATGV